MHDIAGDVGLDDRVTQIGKLGKQRKVLGFGVAIDVANARHPRIVAQIERPALGPKLDAFTG